jgi:hypothetical protein
MIQKIWFVASIFFEERWGWSINEPPCQKAPSLSPACHAELTLMPEFCDPTSGSCVVSGDTRDRDKNSTVVGASNMLLLLRWPTSAPFRCCLFNRFVSVRASTCAMELNKAATRSRMTPMGETEDSDRRSWGETVDRLEGRRVGEWTLGKGVSVWTPQERDRSNRWMFLETFYHEGEWSRGKWGSSQVWCRKFW